MKKKSLLIITIFIMISLVMYIAIKVTSHNESENNNIDNSKLSNDKDKADSDIKIITSLYTTYILTRNLTYNIPNINLTNLTSNSEGCVHDYQLTNDNMKALVDADIFVMNGGGMEGYIEEIIKSYPEIYIIDSSKSIQMLENSYEHEDHEDHDHDHHGHSHGEFNPHIWLDSDLYIKQIKNIRDELISFINKNENYNKEFLITIENNAANYIEQINKINSEINELNKYNSKGVIMFHDSFAYIANKLGIPIIKMIELEHDTSLSAGEVAEVINLIKEKDIKIIFSEAQFSDNIPSKIALETDAKVFIIDSAVSGDGNIDSYINSMEYNIKTIKKALEYESDNW